MQHVQAIKHGQTVHPQLVMVDSMAVNPPFLVSLISSRGTFGQESLFSLRPGNQRDPWPDTHSTADQTGRVPLEWHLEPLQGMRAPTDLQSSRQNLSGLKKRGKRKFYKPGCYEKGWTKLDLGVVVNWPQSNWKCCFSQNVQVLTLPHWQPFALKLIGVYIHIGRLLKTDPNTIWHVFFPHCHFWQ